MLFPWGLAWALSGLWAGGTKGIDNQCLLREQRSQGLFFFPPFPSSCQCGCNACNHYNRLGTYTPACKDPRVSPFVFRHSLRLFQELSQEMQVRGHLLISRCQRKEKQHFYKVKSFECASLGLLSGPRFLGILLIRRSAQRTHNRPAVPISQGDIQSGRFFFPSIISKRGKSKWHPWGLRKQKGMSFFLPLGTDPGALGGDLANSKRSSWDEMLMISHTCSWPHRVLSLFSSQKQSPSVASKRRHRFA